jgi:hypothetical protein
MIGSQGEALLNELGDALRRQMALNETKNLLHAESRWLLQIDPMFLAVVETLLAREAAGPSLPGIEELASEAATGWSWEPCRAVSTPRSCSCACSASMGRASANRSWTPAAVPTLI